MTTLQPSSSPADRLADGDRSVRALRWTATQAASLVGAGVALVYTRSSEGAAKGRLRAASGFRSTDEARRAAAELHPLIGEVFADGQARTCESLAAIGDRGARGVLALPLCARGETL
ncbi:MAG TPA: hypothetical protein VKA74_19390, partial [Myxococcota bacterium]|nr:hypothetical protein [Myxococcota bacterium]